MILITNTSVDKTRFGVAQMETDDNDDLLTRRVDDALYRAKAGGRNRVEATVPVRQKFTTQ